MGVTNLGSSSCQSKQALFSLVVTIMRHYYHGALLMTSSSTIRKAFSSQGELTNLCTCNY
jgi:hypothetical protein